MTLNSTKVVVQSLLRQSIKICSEIPASLFCIVYHDKHIKTSNKETGQRISQEETHYSSCKHYNYPHWPSVLPLIIFQEWTHIAHLRKNSTSNRTRNIQRKTILNLKQAGQEKKHKCTTCFFKWSRTYSIHKLKILYI